MWGSNVRVSEIKRRRARRRAMLQTFAIHIGREFLESVQILQSINQFVQTTHVLLTIDNVLRGA